MKKLLYKLFAFVILFGLTIPAFAAEKYSLVLFYADWNVYSNKAINTLSDVAEHSDDISFEKINIDDKSAFYRMKQLGVMPTRSLPYYFLINKHKKVIYGSTFNNEPMETILSTLKKRIDD